MGAKFEDRTYLSRCEISKSEIFITIGLYFSDYLLGFIMSEQPQILRKLDDRAIREQICAICGEKKQKVVHKHGVPDYAICRRCRSTFVVEDSDDMRMLYGTIPYNMPQTRAFALKQWQSYDEIISIASRERDGKGLETVPDELRTAVYSTLHGKYANPQDAILDILVNYYPEKKESSSTSMTQILSIFQAVLHGWWIIVISAIVTVNAALLAVYFQEPMYESNVQLLVSPGTTLTERDILSSFNPLDDNALTTTYAEILSSRSLMLTVLEELGFSRSLVREYDRNANVLPDSNILRLRVSGPDPQYVALLANTLGERSITRMSELYPVYSVIMLDDAAVAGSPYNLSPIQNAVVAAIIGIGVGLLIAIAREELVNYFANSESRAA